MKLLIKEVYFEEEAPKEDILDRQEEEEELDPSEEALLAALEKEIEKEINFSAKLEETIQFDEGNPLEEKVGVGIGGFNYENQVISALKKAKIAGDIKSSISHGSQASDADMNIYGDIFNVEIKLNPRAQMGGSSVRYNKGGEISLSVPMEPDTNELLIDVVNTNKSQLNKLLDFLAKQSPKSVNQRAVKFPMSVTKKAWEKAQRKGLLVNVVVPLTAKFIADHYAKKGIYYMQIGNAGLFYLAKNPAKLPVPQLKGEIEVEIRSASKGTKSTLKNGTEIIGSGIRVQGRMKTENQSPYTLDDPASIEKMLKKIKKKKKKR